MPFCYEYVWYRLVRVYKVAAERRRRAKQEQELLELVHAGVIEVCIKLSFFVYFLKVMCCVCTVILSYALLFLLLVFKSYFSLYPISANFLPVWRSGQVPKTGESWHVPSWGSIVRVHHSPCDSHKQWLCKAVFLFWVNQKPKKFVTSVHSEKWK